MGKRGRQPQPTALKLARGNPGKRPVNLDEPVLEPASEEAPPDLTGRALEEWRDQAPRLIAVGVLTVGDRSAFATYCRLVAQEADLQELIEKTGMRYSMDLGFFRLLHQTRDQKLRYAQHFGLTPSSRSGIKAKKPVDPADQRRRKFFGIVGGGTSEAKPS